MTTPRQPEDRAKDTAPRPAGGPGRLVARVRDNTTLAAVSAEGFITRLGFSMVSFALPLYALSLHMHVAEIGILYALRTVTVLAVKPVMGWIADRFGFKRTLLGSIALRCGVSLLFVFASEPWHLYALRILQGMMTAARDPSAAALIAEHGDRRRMAMSFAWYTTARDTGRSVGYAAAGLLITATGGFRVVFLAAFLSSCVGLLTVARCVPSRRPSGEPTSSSVPSESASGWPLYRGLLGYASFGVMVATSAEMLQGMFPVIATTYAHLTVAQAGVAVGCASVASLVAGPSFGWVSDRVDRHLALGVRSVANTLSSILYIVFPVFGVYVVARTMDDMGKAAFRPTWGAILAHVSDADPSHRARTMTFLDSSYTLGEVIAPMIAGLLIGVFGIPAMLGARVGLSVLTEIHAVRVFQHERSRNQGRGHMPVRSFPQLVREVAVRRLSATSHQHFESDYVRPAEEAQV